MNKDTILRVNVMNPGDHDITHFKDITKILNECGYNVIMSTNTTNTDGSDVLYVYNDCEITVDDLDTLVKMKMSNDNKCIFDNESIPSDISTLQDEILDIQSFIETINRLIQMHYPDNSELHTNIVLDDNFIATYTDSKVYNYSINSNNPYFLSYLTMILDEDSENEDNLLEILYEKLSNKII